MNIYYYTFFFFFFVQLANTWNIYFYIIYYSEFINLIVMVNSSIISYQIRYIKKEFTEVYFYLLTLLLLL